MTSLITHEFNARKFRLAGFLFCIYHTSMPNGDQDIRMSLARAFDRAWDSYYRSGRLTVSQDLARTELARRLVQLSKEGIADQER